MKTQVRCTTSCAGVLQRGRGVSSAPDNAEHIVDDAGGGAVPGRLDESRGERRLWGRGEGNAGGRRRYVSWTLYWDGTAGAVEREKTVRAHPRLLDRRRV